MISPFCHDLIFCEDFLAQFKVDEDQDKEIGDEEVSWGEEMLKDTDEDDMDVEPDGDEDNNIFLFQPA